jgi:hypothetical protein
MFGKIRSRGQRFLQLIYVRQINWNHNLVVHEIVLLLVTNELDQHPVRQPLLKGNKKAIAEGQVILKATAQNSDSRWASTGTGISVFGKGNNEAPVHRDRL